MLDLAKLAGKIPGISQHLKKEVAASRQRVELAQVLLKKTQARQIELVEIQEKWRDRLLFSAATPVEPLDTRITLNPPPH
ncbi:MAG: DNA double-strand break repair nuclease NurA, partial [Microcystaceae cyanobacterium]